jgi:hypothetical protein
MSEGDVVVAAVCERILLEGEVVDPCDKIGISALLTLDCLGIRGKQILTLFVEVCQRSVLKLKALLRACEYEVADVTPDTIWKAIRSSLQLDFGSIIAEVRKLVPDFASAPEPQPA